VKNWSHVRQLFAYDRFGAISNLSWLQAGGVYNSSRFLAVLKTLQQKKRWFLTSPDQVFLVCYGQIALSKYI